MPPPIPQPSAFAEPFERPLKNPRACSLEDWKLTPPYIVESRLTNQIVPYELAGNDEFLSGLDFVRIFQLVAVGCKDSIVIIRIAVKLFRNL
jgi:hypothetical protein